jgi:hypothetical protein
MKYCVALSICIGPERISKPVPDFTIYDLIFRGKTAHLICPFPLIHVVKYTESQVCEVCVLTGNFFLVGKNVISLGYIARLDSLNMENYFLYLHAKSTCVI